jgi:hypothetical protein
VTVHALAQVRVFTVLKCYSYGDNDSSTHTHLHTRTCAGGGFAALPSVEEVKRAADEGAAAAAERRQQDEAVAQVCVHV